MLYREPPRNKKGQPICEICGIAYNKLLQHVNLAHGIDAKEYKKCYNLHPRKGVQIKWLTVDMRSRAKRNYQSSILENLIIKGQNTRFKEGNTSTNVQLVRKVQIERQKLKRMAIGENKEGTVLLLAKKLRAI